MSPVLTDTRTDLEQGQIVDGRYRVERFLGEGWSGSSYLVAPIEAHRGAGRAAAGSHDAAPSTSARAVLKLLKPRQNIDLQTLKRSGLLTVQHPNLAAPASSGTDPQSGLQYVVWPWLGGTDWVSAARLGGPRELPFLLAPVCRGLAHLHERGAWHGRLHAGNCRVFRGGDGTNRRVVLHDYGLRGIDRQDLPAHDIRDLAWMILRGLLDEPALPESNQLPAPDLDRLIRAAVEPLSPPLAYVVQRCLGGSEQKPFASALEVLDELNRRAGLDLAIDPPELRRPLVLDGRLVGRQRQMEALKRRLEALTGGSLGVPEAPMAVLIGESGVGKSRILREFAAHARKKKVWLVSGACREGGGQAYAALEDALKGIADELERLQEKQGEPADCIHPLLLKYGSELVKVSPELRQKLGLGPSRPLEPEPEKMRLIDQMTYFINDASRSAPIVIVLEDIHWADEGTLDFLRYLCRVARGGSVQVLMTARREEVADSLLKAFLDEGGGEGWLQQIQVEPLPVKEMAQIARQAMNARESTSQTALERICREGEGNPYQLQEILCHLVEQGVLRRQAEGWVLDHSRLDSVPIPEQVAEAFLGRVSRLNQQSREVLQLLAAYARPATVEQLDRMLEQPRWEIQRHVETLTDRAILERITHQQGTLYGFRHARQRAALYGRIEKAVKQGLHARVARELESHRKEQDIHRQAELTRHLVAAGRIQEAFEAGIEAIQALFRGNAFREGKALASHLGEHLDLAPPELRARLLNLLADCLVWQGSPEEAISQYEEALALARTCGREADVAASLSGIVRACFWSRNHQDRERGLSAAREAYRIACRQQDASVAALLLTRWAGFYLEADRLHIAERMLKRA
ncbi:MAG: AAA family ATPase, partial [Acidobacteriota bacterium]